VSNKVLRVGSLPTEDYPASGLTCHKLAEGESDILAIPFPARLCLYKYSSEKLVLDFKIDLRNRNIPRLVRLFYCFYFSFQVARYAKINNISIIHIHWVSLLFIRLFLPKSKKCFLTIHGEDARFLKRGIFRKLSKKVDKIFVVGSYWTKVLINTKLDVEEIPNFSPFDNVNSFKKSKALPLDGSELNETTIGLCFIGSEKKHKNLKIFKELPDEFFNLLNSGKARLDFVGVTQKYVRKLGIPLNSGVTCHGRCSRDKTLHIIASSKLLLIPSFTEGNPKVVWEAVELGVVPIISETLTFFGFKSQDYPYSFDPNSSKGFWSAIERAMSNYSKLELDKYFTISSRDDVRAIYERSYFGGGQQ